MKDVKFRAWIPCKQQMSEVTMLDMVNKEVFYTYKDKERNARYGFDKYKNMATVMQSTGLKDKNGVEIYEGDIVHWLKEFISPMDMRTKRKIDSNKVIHQKESGEWGIGKVGNALSEELFNVEVIGNVYEHPNLLKEIVE